MNNDLKKIIIIFVVISLIALLCLLVVEVGIIFSNTNNEDEELNNTEEEMDSLKDESYNITEEELADLEWLNEPLTELILLTYDNKNISGYELYNYIKLYYNSNEIVVMFKNSDDIIATTNVSVELKTLANAAIAENIKLNDNLLSIDEIRNLIDDDSTYKSYIVDYNIQVVGVMFVKQ